MNQDPEKIGEVTTYHMDEISKPHSTDEVEFPVNDDDEKPHVVKGDDSDGRVEWSMRQILATISLSGLYVGMDFFYLLPTVHGGEDVEF